MGPLVALPAWTLTLMAVIFLLLFIYCLWSVSMLKEVTGSRKVLLVMSFILLPVFVPFFAIYFLFMRLNSKKEEAEYLIE
jgi:thiosulfate reductase cytochrome b subunit